MRTLLFIFICALSGCSTQQFFTESYIKNNIEQHKPEEFSSLTTLEVLSTDALEITGYKHNGKKGLVIAGSYFTFKDSVRVRAVQYVELDSLQVGGILTNYKTARELLKNKAVQYDEAGYEDYTASKEVFLSYRNYHGNNVGFTIFSLWVNGVKYDLDEGKTIKRLAEFVAW